MNRFISFFNSMFKQPAKEATLSVNNTYSEFVNKDELESVPFTQPVVSTESPVVEPVVSEPVVAVVEPPVAVVEPLDEPLVVDEPPIAEPVVAVVEPLVDEPPVDEPPVDEPPVAVVEPPVDEPLIVSEPVVVSEPLIVSVVELPVVEPPSVAETSLHTTLENTLNEIFEPRPTQEPELTQASIQMASMTLNIPEVYESSDIFQVFETTPEKMD
jgi:hypothetical protein